MDNSTHTWTNTCAQANPSSQDSDAKFLGWQNIGAGEFVALYVITATGHPSFGSTVSGRTLDKLNLKVPNIPFSQRPTKNC